MCNVVAIPPPQLQAPRCQKTVYICSTIIPEYSSACLTLRLSEKLVHNHCRGLWAKCIWESLILVTTNPSSSRWACSCCMYLMYREKSLCIPICCASNIYQYISTHGSHTLLETKDSMRVISSRESHWFLGREWQGCHSILNVNIAITFRSRRA